MRPTPGGTAPSPTVIRCWCRSERLEPFSGEYTICRDCLTLVSMISFPDESHRSGHGGFYGFDYWRSYIPTERGQPGIVERTRTDLSERAPFWLREIMRRRLPPARTLEPGCGPGTLLFLMTQAGYEATGTEMDPGVVEIVRGAFGVDVRLGTVEEVAPPPKSLDAVILLDVLEHLPDPAGTLAAVARAMADDGILLIQTPCRREADGSHADMVAEGNPFLSVLSPREHLYLFSEGSLARLLAEAGFGAVEHPRPLFPYDAFVVAGKTSVPPPDEVRMADFLAASPSGRLVGALLDLERRLSDTSAALAASEADRAARLESMISLEGLLKESEADRAARLEVIRNLEERLARSREPSEGGRPGFLRRTFRKTGAGP
jgi:SAM-dependent methyltransferase